MKNIDFALQAIGSFVYVSSSSTYFYGIPKDTPLYFERLTKGGLALLTNHIYSYISVQTYIVYTIPIRYIREARIRCDNCVPIARNVSKYDFELL